MKFLSSLFCILALHATMLYGQTGPKLQFVEKTIELDTLYTDSVDIVKLEIAFFNAGDKPLLVSNARGCCGTRIKSYTREPINPGERGKVFVEFRPAPRPQKISRTVTLTTNEENSVKTIRIKGTVAERPLAGKPDTP